MRKTIPRHRRARRRSENHRSEVTLSDRTAHTETELKFSLDPALMPQVLASPAVQAMASGAPAANDLLSTYYDTPERHLRRAGWALRVRQHPGGFQQTVKSGQGFARGEWQWPLSGPLPALGPVLEAEPRRMLEPLFDQLVPVFTTRFQRTALALAGGSLELALDQGEITAGPGTVPICELELEATGATAEALFAAGARLAEALPLVLESQTKSERGYALADGSAPAAVKAARLTLEDGLDADSAMGRIFAGCLGQILANLPCAALGADPEGVHQLRVGLRRLRAALTLCQRLGGDPESIRTMNDEARWLATAVGAARDWDVFLTQLLPPVEAAFAPPALEARDFTSLRRLAGRERLGAYREVGEALGSRRATVWLLSLAGWIAGRGWRGPQPHAFDQPAAAAAAALLARRARQVRRLARSLADMDDERRHGLRIALKKLRYAAEFFRSPFEHQACERYLRRLVALQDRLGLLNDLATARRLLLPLKAGRGKEAAGAARAAGLLVGWQMRDSVAAIAELPRQWRRFRKARPFWPPPEA
jgi:inorganic triphosphatase YgiF